MLALRLHPGLRLQLHEEPEPELAAGEALVRVVAVGLCGSDRHWIVDGGIGDAVLDRPVVLGHEFGGVALTGRYRDRLVAVDPAIPCERCEPCRTGLPHLCLQTRFAGHGETDGALRERVAWPEHCLFPLSDALSGPGSALIEPLAIAVHAIGLNGPLAGATVAVVGCGPIGLLVIALARVEGAASIVAIDPLPHRREAAAAYGATTVLEATPAGDERAAGLAATNGRGVDVAIDTAGESSAVDTCVHLARPGGTVILAGIPSDDRTAFNASAARRNELTLRVSRRSMPADFRRAVQLAESRLFDLDALVTLRTPLTDAPRAFDALVARSGIKVIVEPSEGARA